LICANAGVDISNVADTETVCTLPRDPDSSAKQLHQALSSTFHTHIGVVISDTFGRPWREGLTNIAIGVGGIEALRDYVGMRDPTGHVLQVTKLAIADELAGAAELVMGKLDRVPAAIIRGFSFDRTTGSAHELLRRPEQDLFRY